jgi:predicted Zn-dependent peptidase
MKESDLKIITNDNNYFHIQVYIPIGSIHEKKGQYGISHFLEHLKFNRSKKYENDKFKKILGNYKYNAFTTLDHTSYYITSIDKNYKKIIDIMNEIVFNTSFTNNEINKERKIVLAEKVHRQQDKFIMNDRSIYHPKNPYNRPVIGKVSNINKLTNKDFKKYNEQYINKYFVFVSCSKNIESKVKNICLKKFPMPIKKDIIPLPNINLYNYELTVRNIIDNKQIIFFTFKTFASNNPDSNYIDILDHIIIKSRLSKLVSLLREKHGFIYTLESSNFNFINNGFYTIQIIINKNLNVKKVIKLIFNEFNKLKNDNLTDKELEKYKNNYIKMLQLKLKDYKFYLNFFGEKLFHNQDFEIEKYFTMINDLTSNKMNDIFNKILNYYQMNVVLYGNFDNINKTNNKIYNLITKYRND